jgi:hypothetical protein
MAIVSQPRFAIKILEALGLNAKKVVGLSLHMRVNELVTAEVEMLPTGEQMDEIAADLEVRKFVVQEVTEDA